MTLSSSLYLSCSLPLTCSLPICVFIDMHRLRDEKRKREREVHNHISLADILSPHCNPIWRWQQKQLKRIESFRSTHVAFFKHLNSFLGVPAAKQAKFSNQHHFTLYLFSTCDTRRFLKHNPKWICVCVCVCPTDMEFESNMFMCVSLCVSVRTLIVWNSHSFRSVRKISFVWCNLFRHV